MIVFKFLKIKKINYLECLYAIKTLKKDVIIRKNYKKNAMCEKNILSLSKSKFIVKLYWSFQDESKIYYVLEFLQGGINNF